MQNVVPHFTLAASSEASVTDLVTIHFTLTSHNVHEFYVVFTTG